MSGNTVIRMENTAFTKADSTAIRGMAALGIMISHYTIWMESYFSVKLRGGEILLKQLGGIGVLVFFFLSGYGVWLSSSDKKLNLMWLIERLGRVYLPYLFIKFVIEIIHDSAIGWNRFLLGDFLKEITGIDFSDWFIWVIMLQYIIFWTAYKISRDRGMTGVFVLSLMLMMVFIRLGLASRWYNGLLLFWFGCFVAKWQEKIIIFLKENYYLKLCLLFLGFMGISILYIIKKGSVLTECFKILAGMILAVILIAVCMKLSFKSHVLEWIGKRSLFIYIVHVNLWGIICYKVENADIVLPLAVCSAFLVTAVLYEGYRYISKVMGRSKR